MTLTGRQIAIEMAQEFQGRDWIAALAERAGQSRDFVEWHLQEDMIPPPELQSAVDALLRDHRPPLVDNPPAKFT